MFFFRISAVCVRLRRNTSYRYGSDCLSRRTYFSARAGPVSRMGAMHIDLAGGRRRELRGATLALVVERPGHGNELASRLNHRLGPTWKVEPRQVYAILKDLAKDGLVTRR